MDGELINTECVVDKMEDMSYELLVKMEREGHYITRVVYNGQNIGPANGFTIICLTGTPGHMTRPLLSHCSLT